MFSVPPAGCLQHNSLQSSVESSLSISFSALFSLLQAGLGSSCCVLLRSCSYLYPVTTYLIASSFPHQPPLAMSLLGQLLEWGLRFMDYLQLARHCTRRVLSIILINFYILLCEVDFIIFILWMGKWWLRDIK